MDPLSVAASTTALLTLCYQAITTTRGIIEEYKNVDSSINDLLSEIKGLSSVLESIEKLWTRHPMIRAAQSSEESEIWSAVQASLKDCQATIIKLSEKIGGVRNGSFFKNSFLKKTSAAIKLNWSKKDIILIKQKVSWHQAEMQGAFQMINVCLLLRSNATQESTNQGILALQLQIDKMESTISKQMDIHSRKGHAAEDKVELPPNFTKLARTANSLRSNASSIVGDVDRSTLWEGSTMGDPLSHERPSWIPPKQEQTSRWILDNPVGNDNSNPAIASMIQLSDINGSNNPSAVTARPIFGAFPAASIVAELMDAIQKLSGFIDSIIDTPSEVRRLGEDLESLQLAVTASTHSFQSQDAQSPLFQVLQVCLTSFRQLGITLDDWQKLDQGADWRTWTKLVDSFGQKRMVELGVQVECASALLLVALQPAYQQTMAPDTAPPFLDILGVRSADVELRTGHDILEVEEEDE